jgi:deoxyribonuclease-1
MIARTYKYMAGAYPRYNMGGPTEKLMEAWDKMYPPDAWECTRAKRIETIQGNENPVTKARCLELRLWN